MEVRRWSTTPVARFPSSSLRNIKKALDKITQATVPPKFTQDFLATTPRSCPVAGAALDQVPETSRLPKSEGTANRSVDASSATRRSAGHQLRKAFGTHIPNSDVANEHVHNASDKDLKGLILQVTGLNRLPEARPGLSSRPSRRPRSLPTSMPSVGPGVDEVGRRGQGWGHGQRPRPASTSSQTVAASSLGYRINLNLPATTDIAVFNAIFITPSRALALTKTKDASSLPDDGAIIEEELDTIERELPSTLADRNAATRGGGRLLPTDRACVPRRGQSNGPALRDLLLAGANDPHVVADSLEAADGPGWWSNPSRVPGKIKDECEARLTKEKDAVSRCALKTRSTSPLSASRARSYRQRDVLRALFKSEKAVSRVHGQPEQLRGPIAHCTLLA